MKTKIKSIIVVCLIFILPGCKKSTESKYTASASITVTNAVIGGSAIVLNGSANDYNSVVSPNGSQQFPLLTGQTQLQLNDPTTDPVVTYYNQPLTVTDKGIYSLFLTGSSPAAVDAIIVTEHFENYKDSVCGVRFINLAPGGPPLSINIQGSTQGDEIPSLAYKSYSEFKAYPATLADLLNGINFEVRNAATGDLLTTFGLIPNTFQNVTLAISGDPMAPQIIQINNF